VALLGTTIKGKARWGEGGSNALLKRRLWKKGTGEVYSSKQEKSQEGEDQKTSRRESMRRAGRHGGLHRTRKFGAQRWIALGKSQCVGGSFPEGGGRQILGRKGKGRFAGL